MELMKRPPGSPKLVERQRMAHERRRNMMRRNFGQPKKISHKHRNFLDHFYPNEQILLKTFNFEDYNERDKKTNKFFNNFYELNSYLLNISDSSLNEDRPTPSEELFLDYNDRTSFESVLEPNGNYYSPPLTHKKAILLKLLSKYVITPKDTAVAEAIKRKRRLSIIEGYIRELKRKRYAKAFKKFLIANAQRLNLANEAVELERKEIEDKKLKGPCYYERREPNEIKTLWLKRRNAIAKKYDQYVKDKLFRRTYRKRIFYNVNESPLDYNVQDTTDGEELNESKFAFNRPGIRHSTPKGSPELRKRNQQNVQQLSPVQLDYSRGSTNQSPNEIYYDAEDCFNQSNMAQTENMTYSRTFNEEETAATYDSEEDALGAEADMFGLFHAMKNIGCGTNRRDIAQDNFQAERTFNLSGQPNQAAALDRMIDRTFDRADRTFDRVNRTVDHSPANRTFDRSRANRTFDRSPAYRTRDRSSANRTFDRSPANRTRDRSIANRTFDRSPANHTRDRSIANRTFDRAPANRTFDRSPANRTFDCSPANRTFDRGNRTFERSPANRTFDRSPTNRTFDRPTANRTFDRSPVNRTSDRSPANRTFDRSPANRTFDHPADNHTFDRSHVNRTFDRSPANRTSDRSPANRTFDHSPANRTFNRPAANRTFDRSTAGRTFDKSPTPNANNLTQTRSKKKHKTQTSSIGQRAPLNQTFDSVPQQLNRTQNNYQTRELNQTYEKSSDQTQSLNKSRVGNSMTPRSRQKTKNLNNTFGLDPNSPQLNQTYDGSPIPQLNKTRNLNDSRKQNNSVDPNSPQLNQTYDGSPSAQLNQTYDGSPSAQLNQTFDGSPAPQLNQTYDGSPSAQLNQTYDGSPQHDQTQNRNIRQPNFDGTFDGQPNQQLDETFEQPKGVLNTTTDGSRPHDGTFDAPNNNNTYDEIQQLTTNRTFEHDEEDYSSFNDDNVASSENEFISEHESEPFVENWIQPITRRRQQLLNTLSKLEPSNATRPDEKALQELRRARMKLIEEFHTNLLLNRRRKAFNRFNAIKLQHLDPKAEAAALCELELQDKKLNRDFYYEPNEPSVYKELREKRRRAIERKYDRYATDEKFRKRYARKFNSPAFHPKGGCKKDVLAALDLTCSSSDGSIASSLHPANYSGLPDWARDSDFKKDPINDSYDRGYINLGDKKDAAMYRTCFGDQFLMEKKRDRLIELGNQRRNKSCAGKVEFDDTLYSSPEKSRESLYDYKQEHYEWVDKQNDKFYDESELI